MRGFAKLTHPIVWLLNKTSNGFFKLFNIRSKKDDSVTEEEINAIKDRVKAEVEESVAFAEESPLPNDDEIYKDVYSQEDYPFIVD